MAYIDQSKKSRIAAALKSVVPAGWKYSLAVRHHSTLVLTIAAAPFDLFGALASFPSRPEPSKLTHADLNVYHLRAAFADECVADVFSAILDVLNLENHDRSDIQSDYFDVGHYVSIQLGRWDRPFVLLPAAGVVAAA